MLQKNGFAGGKQSFIEGIGQYSKSLFDKMWLQHMLRVERTLILSGTAHMLNMLHPEISPNA